MEGVSEFEVDVSFVFKGTVRVRAADAGEALVIVNRDVGLVMGGSVHTSNPDVVTDWDFDTHPTQIPSNVRRFEGNG